MHEALRHMEGKSKLLMSFSFAGSLKISRNQQLSLKHSAYIHWCLSSNEDVMLMQDIQDN